MEVLILLKLLKASETPPCIAYRSENRAEGRSHYIDSCPPLQERRSRLHGPFRPIRALLFAGLMLYSPCAMKGNARRKACSESCGMVRRSRSCRAARPGASARWKSEPVLKGGGRIRYHAIKRSAAGRQAEWYRETSVSSLRTQRWSGFFYDSASGGHHL